MKRRQFLKAALGVAWVAALAPAALRDLMASAPPPPPPVPEPVLLPNTMGAWVQVSRRILSQANLELEEWIREDLSRALAHQLDQAILEGTVADQDGRPVLERTALELGPVELEVDRYSMARQGVVRFSALQEVRLREV